MSSRVTYPAQGISRVAIEELGRDAQVRGVPELDEIVITPANERDDAGQFSVDGEDLRFHGAAVARVLVPAEMNVDAGDAAGDLLVQGLDGDLTLQTVHGDLRLREIRGSVGIEQVNGDLRADGVSRLEISGSCDGDMHCHDSGLLTVDTVAGDLRISGVEAARIEAVNGDFSAENVRGDARVSEVAGDARLDTVAGQVDLQRVGGDLRAADLGGGLDAPNVGGDAHLSGSMTAEQSYTVRADGDVQVRLPDDADLKLSVKAGGRIRSAVQLVPAPDGSRVFTAVIGPGNGRVSISSGGDVRISQTGAEGRSRSAFGSFDDLGEHIRQQVSASLTAAGINPETGEFDWSRFDPGRGTKGPRGRGPGAPRPTEAASPPRSPAPGAPSSAGPGGGRRQPGGSSPSPEEQLAILKMVEAGTITADEAETLLRALGS